MEQSCRCLLGSPLDAHASESWHPHFLSLILRISPLALCLPPEQAHCPAKQLSPVVLFSFLERSEPHDPHPPPGLCRRIPLRRARLTCPCARPCPCSPAELGAAAGGEPGRAGRGEEEGAREAGAGNRKQDCEQPGTGPGRSQRRLCCPLLPSAPGPGREHGAGDAPGVPRAGHAEPRDLFWPRRQENDCLRPLRGLGLQSRSSSEFVPTENVLLGSPPQSPRAVFWFRKMRKFIVFTS